MLIGKLRPLLILSLCTFFASLAFSQKPCVKFKHVEFFVPAKLDVPNWSETQLSELIDTKTDHNQSFFVPFIVKQLAEYEPGCGTRAIDGRFELLVKLYSMIRNDHRVSADRTARGKLELIRNDFYKQINDDQLIDGLIFTMDDGPLMGKVLATSDVKPLVSREYATAFGRIRFANIRGGVAVSALDKKGRTLWSRVLEGTSPERDLREADLKTLTVEETSFVIVARLYVDGERLTLYTRPNGRFMYYRHSW